MNRIVLLGLVAVASGIVPATARPLIYTLPDETAAYKPGPNLDLVQRNCGGCHSADYVLTQPPGPGFSRAFWQAEVNKMITVFGAPIATDEIPGIVDYLTAMR